MPIETKTLKNLPNMCQVKSCHKKLDLANNFLCKNCNKYYCLSHRFDFSHNCSKEENNDSYWKNYVSNFKLFNSFSSDLRKEIDGN